MPAAGRAADRARRAPSACAPDLAERTGRGAVRVRPRRLGGRPCLTAAARRSRGLRYTGTGAPQVVATARRARRPHPRARARGGRAGAARPELAGALAALDLGDEVPEEMWKAVAEVLAWAYRSGSGRDYPKRVMWRLGSWPDTGWSASSSAS